MAEFQTSVARGGVRADIDAGLKAYMSGVYMLMSIAMIVTGAFAYGIGQDLLALRQGQETLLPRELLLTAYAGWGKWIIMLAPLALVFFLSFRIHAMSYQAAQGTFWLYAALVGVSIASIFAVFTGVSIAQTFLVTAIAFLSLSLYGYTTKRDLSGMGTFLIMGLIGLIVAMVVNIFLESSALSFAISVIGVLIFAGLTAYDTQRIKSEYIMMANAGPEGQAFMQKGALMGALSLYLNFLNMFLFLLQFMGATEE